MGHEFTLVAHLDISVYEGISTSRGNWAPGATTPPPPRTKIFLISCSFWENPANLYVGAPPGLAPPPMRNPVFAPAEIHM